MTAATPSHYVLVATPGPLGIWAFQAVRALAAQQGRALSQLNRADPVPDALAAPDPCLYLTHEPGQSVIDAIAAGPLKPVLLVTDPAADVAGLMRTGLLQPDALRAGTAAMTAHCAIRQRSGSHLVWHGHDPAGPALQQLAAALGLAADEAAVGPVLAGLAPGHAATASLDAAVGATVPGHTSDRAGERAGSVEELAAQVLQPLHLLAQGRAVERDEIIWPAGALMWGDKPGELPPPVAPVTGPARVIYYGPYFHLPPADYDAEITLTFFGRIEDIPFSLELHGSTRLVRVMIEGRASGRYSGRFRFRHTNPADMIELRLRSERGAIEGEISLHNLRFFPDAPRTA
jgi:hypothetical protein